MKPDKQSQAEGRRQKHAWERKREVEPCKQNCVRKRDCLQCAYIHKSNQIDGMFKGLNTKWNQSNSIYLNVQNKLVSSYCCGYLVIQQMLVVYATISEQVNKMQLDVGKYLTQKRDTSIGFSWYDVP